MLKRLGARVRGLGQDRIVVIVLLACTAVSALTSPISPFPRDGWFESQYRLFGRFPGEDDYTPIAVPAVFYKVIHWLALAAGLDLKGEMYLASLAQNCLLFLSACLVYYTSKLVGSGRVAAFVAIVFLLFVLSTGVAQAFWSENVVLAMFAAVLYLNTKIYYQTVDSSCGFWRRALLSSLLTGLLVITRLTPALLIPGIFFLLHGRLGRARLLGYTALACLITALLLGVMLASNQARFGRTELTNSSGRHLWQGVTPIVDTALADSPEFLELKVLDPKIQAKSWFEVRLPGDSRQEFDGEALLGRLAAQAIRNHPLLYLRLGLTKFVTGICQPPYRLGSDLKGNHHLLAADPLKAGALLPPPGEEVLKLPTQPMQWAQNALGAVFSIGQILYPIAVFLVLSSYSALIVQGVAVAPIQGGDRAGMMKHAAWWHLIAGVLFLGMIYSTVIPRPLAWLVRGLCALVLLWQALIIGRESRIGRADDQPFNAARNGIVYTFLAAMFFGSLWLSWQSEVKNTRNVLPYLPFLSVMLAIALSYWRKRGANAIVPADLRMPRSGRDEE
jgi:hypothetical protein